MVTPVNVSINGWTKQSVTPFYDGNYVNSSRIVYIAPVDTSSQVYNMEGGTVGQILSTDGSGTNHYCLSKTTFSTTNAHSGTKGAKATITAGDAADQTWGCWWNFGGNVYEGGEMWLSAWVLVPGSFSWAGWGGKGLRLFEKQPGGSKTGQVINLYIGPNGYYPLVANFGEDSGSYWAWAVENGVAGSVLGPAPAATWESIEIYVKVSTSITGGTFRYWRNGVNEINCTDRCKTLSNSDNYYTGAAFLTFWGNDGYQGSEQSLFFDDVILTTTEPTTKDVNGLPCVTGAY